MIIKQFGLTLEETFPEFIVSSGEIFERKTITKKSWWTGKTTTKVIRGNLIAIFCDHNKFIRTNNSEFAELVNSRAPDIKVYLNTYILWE